jgi:hypothetical protein
LKRIRLIVFGLIALAIMGAWLAKRQPIGISQFAPATDSAVQPVTSVPASVPDVSQEMLPSPDELAPTTPQSSEINVSEGRISNSLLTPARAAANGNPDVAANMAKIALMFRNFRTIEGENPIGTNAEIMKSIMGENSRGARLGPPEGMTVNGNGELVDPWGTPFFFHALTKDVMEIRSAGPDKRMWNEDDLMSE